MTSPTVARRSLLAAAGATAAVAALPGSPALAGDPLLLAAGGNTDYQILIGSSEGDTVVRAASEMKDYLGRMTGATFPLIAIRNSSHPRLIVLGTENDLVGDLIASVDLGEDGFRIATDGDRILIAGAIPRGTLYGAYWFLDRICGIRWYAPGADGTVVPERSTLSIPSASLNTTQRPRFRYRTILAKASEDRAYRHHNMLNGLRDHYWTIESQAPAEDFGLGTWSHYWPEENWPGPLPDRVTRGTYNELVASTTLRYGGQLLSRDPRTWDEAAIKIGNDMTVRANHGMDLSAACYQNDNRWAPVDAASQQFADQHGGHLSACVIDLANKVIERVRNPELIVNGTPPPAYPTARLETQAYSWSIEPPVGVQPHPGLVVTIACIDSNFAHSQFTGDNVGVGASINGWGALTDELVVWDYMANYTYLLLPFPSWWAGGETIKALANTPVQGFFGEGDNSVPDMHLRTWVLSRLLWDPTLEVDDLIREFTYGYYRAAGSKIYQYLSLLAESVRATGSWLGTFDTWSTAKYLNLETIVAADQLLAAATALVASDSVAALRVRAMRVGFDATVLLNRHNLDAQAAAAGIAWRSDKDVRLARMKADFTATGVYWTGATQLTAGSWLQWINESRTVAAPPSEVAGLDPSQWIDVEDRQMVVKVGHYAPDAKASDGYAARAKGYAPLNSMEFSCRTLPGNAQWRVFAVVRIQLLAGATPAPGDAAFIIGSTIDPTQQTTYTFKDYLDQEYHTIELAGGPYSYTDPRLYFVLAPNAPCEWLWLDRVFAIRTS